MTVTEKRELDQIDARLPILIPALPTYARPTHNSFEALRVLAACCDRTDVVIKHSKAGFEVCNLTAPVKDHSGIDPDIKVAICRFYLKNFDAEDLTP